MGNTSLLMNFFPKVRLYILFIYRNDYYYCIVSILDRSSMLNFTKVDTQVLCHILPSLVKLRKEGLDGQEKIKSYMYV